MEQSTHIGRGFIQRIRTVVFDLVMPIYCIGCGIERTHCCLSCEQQLSALVMAPRCFYCQRPTVPGSRCDRCPSETLPATLAWIGSYANPLLQAAVRELKFGLRRHLGIVLGQILAQRCSFDGDGIVVAIPLSPRRLLERGFNQAGIIAQTIAAQRGWTYVPDLLERVRNTSAQATLEHHARPANIAGAFRVPLSSSDLIPSKILLVDDVWTTGSTMEEATRVLKEAGVKEVFGAVVAVG
ncbi:ComF family protein [Candidatus Uhrbacteria bacterium]|nr:ComF family protein [Candidatus Uhrbacteria bacterium]